ncbi:SufE family protein [Alloalcanivorax xenomutans]|uniref:SufE family protein n=1 Tax=Alloalcanivorax xenomutans TaxID=1094342 RepID=A0A9Q3W553_9GAMM|nr:SufE family protein [Alloalcanivorax xenomutans]ERS13511.1 Fe-S metabolism protein SufE [Alcanivorax sp. PN-3]KYZ84889.1 Fe-S metabolism protein SufE [Alcanivorax sp. KX64203]MBA4723275.1 SufE family protein [Alcanivorax sp.]ARB44974.1 Fe-S metabolism protein SufE [Alloalcanivorax xenomutans]MCE7508915.1 SufE family protein [Alloalcanivorax xenomutans]
MSDFDIRAITLGENVTAEDVRDDLEFLDDWEERYRYIIDLGKQLPELPDTLRTEDRFVRGCQSQVWLVTDYDDSEGRLYLAVDSDAIIVRGLAAIVLTALNRRSPEQIAAVDMDAFFQDIDLFGHLSPTRGNGLRAMVARIKQEAAALAA